MQEISKSLAGRCGVLNMMNLSWREVAESFKTHGGQKYIFIGGFPELYARPEIDPHFWHASYLSTYLEVMKI
ncbi:hypothetical protein D1BOALGB6SA_1261 [Olavius sp. associated proteobacterium Delta 1]|nr:hypothetical protein D1BOALGB6SA_1261 [Olavius sp. associated proteobacterium Delta 1]